jgi:hypothetical protein
MDRFCVYSGLLVVGLSSTTIAAAVVGRPVPVVIPAVAATLLVAGHHVRTDDPDAGDDRAGQTRAFGARTDGGHDDRADGPDGSLDEWMNEQEGRR